jgi:large subunit ribosomal protein L25
MLHIEMSAFVRSSVGKGAMRKLRAEGRTPAVVYGAGGEALKLELDTKALMAKLLAFYRRNTLVTLKIDNGQEKDVVIGEVQTDPVRDTLIHVDFVEIDLNVVRQFKVPVVYKGVPKGVDLGGILNIQYHEIVLAGKPKDIPDECELDISGLGIGDYVRCGKIEIPVNVELISDRKAFAVSVIKAGQRLEDSDEEDEAAGEVEAAVAE